MRNIKRIASVFLIAFGFSCASDSATRTGYNEQLSRQRTALVQLESRDDYAARAQMEISEVDTLLRRIEIELSKDSTERVDVMLASAESRLSSLQALYAQWEQEWRLERTRLIYEETALELKQTRKDNLEVFDRRGK